jgi:competence ComEA-like helix-hairpin-helix protein
MLGLSSLSVSAQAPHFPPDGPGRDTFESVCSLCHAPTAAAGKLWTRTQWEEKVAEMLQEEPDVTPQERTAIVEYLSSHFKPGGNIYVNYATAKDLTVSLEISMTDAEAIVRYREVKGSFGRIEELTKVPGVGSAPASKIDARKDRLDFARD